MPKLLEKFVTLAVFFVETLGVVFLIYQLGDGLLDYAPTDGDLDDEIAVTFILLAATMSMTLLIYYFHNKAAQMCLKASPLIHNLDTEFEEEDDEPIQF